jgi:hypothetical protein
MVTAIPSIEQVFGLSSKKVFTVFKKGVNFWSGEGRGVEIEDWRLRIGDRGLEREGGGVRVGGPPMC